MNVALGDGPAQAGMRGRRTEFALAEHVAVSVWCRIPAAGARGRLAGEDDRQEASVRIVAAPSPWGVRNLYWASFAGSEAMGCRAVGRARRCPQPRDRRRDPPSHRQAQLEDPHQRSGPAQPRPPSPDPGRSYPQVSVPGTGVAAALAAAADHGGGYGPRPDRRGAVLRRRLRLDFGRCRPPPHHSRTARQGARGALADALARLGRRARCRTPPMASTLRWSATTSTAWSVPTACLRRDARPGAGTAAGTATWTTCTRSMRCASNWTELRAHPEEGRWRDTRRDNANLVQGTDTLRYGWPDATEHRCRTAAEIGAVLRRRGWTGSLRPCGPGCTAARPNRAGRSERGLRGMGGAD